MKEHTKRKRNERKQWRLCKSSTSHICDQKTQKQKQIKHTHLKYNLVLLDTESSINGPHQKNHSNTYNVMQCHKMLNGHASHEQKTNKFKHNEKQYKRKESKQYRHMNISGTYNDQLCEATPNTTRNLCFYVEYKKEDNMWQQYEQ